jgi:hypothetical protein
MLQFKKNSLNSNSLLNKFSLNILKNRHLTRLYDTYVDLTDIMLFLQNCLKPSKNQLQCLFMEIAPIVNIPITIKHSIKQFPKVIDGHLLDHSQLMGKYKRS